LTIFIQKTILKKCIKIKLQKNETYSEKVSFILGYKVSLFIFFELGILEPGFREASSGELKLKAVLGLTSSSNRATCLTGTGVPFRKSLEFVVVVTSEDSFPSVILFVEVDVEVGMELV
jgi:hypothetical protein